jgi:hypothetical protein
MLTVQSVADNASLRRLRQPLASMVTRAQLRELRGRAGALHSSVIAHSALSSPPCCTRRPSWRTDCASSGTERSVTRRIGRKLAEHVPATRFGFVDATVDARPA